MLSINISRGGFGKYQSSKEQSWNKVYDLFQLNFGHSVPSFLPTASCFGPNLVFHQPQQHPILISHRRNADMSTIDSVALSAARSNPPAASARGCRLKSPLCNRQPGSFCRFPNAQLEAGSPRLPISRIIVYM